MHLKRPRSFIKTFVNVRASTVTINFNKDNSALEPGYEANECTYLCSRSATWEQSKLLSIDILAVLLPLLQAMAQTDRHMAKLILVLGWFRVQVLAAGSDALRAPHEVGGTNDVTVSNRVNLVDPVLVLVLELELAIVIAIDRWPAGRAERAALCASCISSSMVTMFFAHGPSILTNRVRYDTKRHFLKIFFVVYSITRCSKNRPFLILSFF